MLKHIKFSGMFQDENLSVNVTLENSVDYGFEWTILLFSVTVKAKNNNNITPKLEDFTFYVMDEANRLYNAQRHLRSAHNFQNLILRKFSHFLISFQIKYSKRTRQELRT